MAYTFPESLRSLREWLKKQGADVNSFTTDRQAAFMAQQLAGSRFKFPERGQPMFPVLLKIQETISAAAPREVEVTKALNDSKSKPGKSKGKKRHEEFDSAAVKIGLHIFCDGAAVPNPGLGGWGFVVYEDGKETAHGFGGDRHATNNQMEICALLNAIDKAKVIGGPATIWCDSEYCVKGVNEWMQNWKKRGWKKSGKEEVKNAEHWQSIDAALSGSHQITIRWCKGHAGIVGNERADELSNLGMAAVSGSEGEVGKEPVDYLTAQYRQMMEG